MNRAFQAVVAALILAASFGGPVTAGLLEDAATAYMKGDYVTASRPPLPLSEEGNADPQARLLLIDAGAAYRKGDYATALLLVRPLAERGNVHAQARLALLYDLGRASRRTTRPR